MIDILDIGILWNLSERKINFSAYALTKIIFPDIKDSRALARKSENIKQKLNKLTSYGFVNRNIIDDTNFFSINKERVIFIKNLIVKVKRKNIVFERMIMLKENSNKWNLMQL